VSVFKALLFISANQKMLLGASVRAEARASAHPREDGWQPHAAARPQQRVPRRRQQTPSFPHACQPTAAAPGMPLIRGVSQQPVPTEGQLVPSFRRRSSDPRLSRSAHSPPAHLGEGHYPPAIHRQRSVREEMLLLLCCPSPGLAAECGKLRRAGDPQALSESARYKYRAEAASSNTLLLDFHSATFLPFPGQMAPSTVFVEPDNLLTPKEKNKVSPGTARQLRATLSAVLIAAHASWGAGPRCLGTVTGNKRSCEVAERSS